MVNKSRRHTAAYSKYAIFLAIWINLLGMDAYAGADPTNAKCDPANFRVAVDVGHSVDAPGAISSRGVTEYEFNVHLASRLKQALINSGFQSTELIFGGSGPEGLIERSIQANEIPADLLISIHHDSVQSIYLEQWYFNGQPHHFSDRFSGYSIFVSYENEKAKSSIRFAELLADQLLARGLHFSTHHAENIEGEARQLIDAKRGIYRRDDLSILRHTTAPSVLFEVGIIVNRDEELSLMSPLYQESIIAAVVAATKTFCEEQR